MLPTHLPSMSPDSITVQPNMQSRMTETNADVTGKSLLVFLHGSGSSGVDVLQFLSVMPLDSTQNYLPFREIAGSHSVDIIAPTATKQKYAPNFGQDSTVWFNRASDFLTRGREDEYEDVEGATQSIRQIMRIIDEKESNYDHIFLGGISMGGCCALHALRFDLHPKVRGIFTMGSFLIAKSVIFNEDMPLGKSGSLPVLMMHGTADSMIRHKWGEETAISLQLRVNVRFESYDQLDHEIGEGELVDLLAWMIGLRESASGYAADESGPIPEEEEDAQAWADVEAASKFEPRPLPSIPDAIKASTKKEGATTNGKVSGIDYIVEIDPDNPNIATLRFPIPADIADQVIPLLIARPILACGGLFEITRDPSSCGVMTIVQSPDPDNLAKEVGSRLANRIAGGGGSLDACPMS